MRMLSDWQIFGNKLTHFIAMLKKEIKKKDISIQI